MSFLKTLKKMQMLVIFKVLVLCSCLCVKFYNAQNQVLKL